MSYGQPPSGQSAKSVLVPIAEGTEEIECVTIVDTLRRGGCNVTVAGVSNDGNAALQMSRGVHITADVPMSSIDKQQQFDAIVLPGGAVGAAKLAQCSQLSDLIRYHQQHHQQFILAAICAAPGVVLSGQGLLPPNLDTVVCHPAFAKKLIVKHDGGRQTVGHLKAGQEVAEGERVAVNGNLITSQGPGTSLEFALAILHALYQSSDHTNSVAQPMVVNFDTYDREVRQTRIKQSRKQGLKDVRAIGFDLFGTIFDTQSPVKKMQSVLSIDSATADRIGEMWRIKQLDFTWIRSLAGNYVPFSQCTEDALDVAVAAVLHPNSDSSQLTADQKSTLLEEYKHLGAYKEVKGALAKMRQQHNDQLKLYGFSNGTPDSMNALLTNAGILEHLHSFYSVHSLQKFKPHPDVYCGFAKFAERQPHECLLVSSNPFDIVGASVYGWHTVWINRTGKMFDKLGVQPDFVVRDMTELAELLKSQKQGQQ